MSMKKFLSLGMILVLVVSLSCSFTVFATEGETQASEEISEELTELSTEEAAEASTEISESSLGEDSGEEPAEEGGSEQVNKSACDHWYREGVCTKCKDIAGSGVPGDMTGDSVVNAEDVVRYVKILLNISTQSFAGHDLNGDDQADMSDLVCLLRALANNQTSLLLSNHVEEIVDESDQPSPPPSDDDHGGKDKPDGEGGEGKDKPDGEGKDKPDGEGGEGGGKDKPDGEGGGEGGGSSGPDSYDAVISVTEDTEFTGQSLSSANGDENVIHVYEGAKATVSGCTVTNGGDGTGGDNASFYGVGASLLVSDGKLYVSDTTINSTTAGGAGVFAYDTGVAYVSGASISTTKSSAGGLHVAGGGTLYAWDCNVTTGASDAAAAIRSDRGGGLMVIDGGTYTTQGGTGAVYVTADITVHDADLYAGGSEAVAIEGKNTLRLFDCELEGNMKASAVNDNQTWNIIVYQSMSGDAAVGTSEFDMIGGSLTTHAGPVVLNTNTSSYITFRDVDITYGEDTTYFLQVTGNSSSRTWGTAGKNGANCVFSAYEQDMEHDVLYDTISNLDFYMLDGSTLEGAMLCDNTYNGGYDGDGVTNMYIDEDSVWTVTGDSVITGTLYLEGRIEGAKVVDTKGTVYVDGSGFTVTVGAFSDNVDSSSAGTVPVWEDYEVENPFD